MPPCSSSPPTLFRQPRSLALRDCHTHKHVTGPGIAKARDRRRTAAQCLRDMREALGWTIGRAATSYGVTSRTWSSWEHGRSTIDADALLWLQGEMIGRTGT